MGKPTDTPLGQTRVRRLVISSGHTRLELDGEGILLTAPVVFDLITKVLAAGASTDPADLAKIVAATQAVTDETDRLSAAVTTPVP